jgi:hypothetical protein
MKATLRIALVALVAAAVSPAAVLDFRTNLGPEALGATGDGSAIFSFDTTAQTLSIDTSWSGLSGTTTVAHIHCCVATPGTGNASVAVTPGTLPGFPTGLTSGTYSILLDLTDTSTYTSGFLTANGGTVAGASAGLLAAMQERRAYLNIHSSTFGGGEIRGYIAAVPEPATLALTGLMLAGLIAVRRSGAGTRISTRQ